MIDLASRALGGSVMAASDESFGEKENLLVPDAPVVRPGRYGHKGEIVDGWETRRQRGPRSHGASDWALIRLGAAGTVEEIVVDTTGFTGNQPPFVRVEGVRADPHLRADVLLGTRTPWRDLVASSSVAPDKPNVYLVPAGGAVTHLLLTIFPDGGVARLRAHGTAAPELGPFEGLTVNLLAAELGARVVAQTDAFYSGAENLLLPGPARSMAEGWEARRLRGDDPQRHDRVVFALAAAGEPLVLEVDTRWFVANASESVAVWVHAGVEATAGDPSGTPAANDAGWRPLLERTELVPDAPHRWRVSSPGPVRHLRVDAYPDGGLSRVRLHGTFRR